MRRTQLSAGRRKVRSAFVCAIGVALIPALGGQSKPNQEPGASQPARETAAAAFRRLGKIPAKERSREQIALKTALELALAITDADGERAAKLLDAVGYQALPLEGDLPDKPEKPVKADKFRARVGRRSRTDLDRLPAHKFEVKDGKALRKEFPAVSTWMLSRDLAVVIRPAKEVGTGWVGKSCCVVVRLRARKPTVVAGNLLAALSESAARPDGREP